jgi:hypothetical protein
LEAIDAAFGDVRVRVDGERRPEIIFEDIRRNVEAANMPKIAQSRLSVAPP